MSKSSVLHIERETYINDHSKNELAHILLTDATRNKQGSKNTRVQTVVHLSFTMMKSRKYT